MQIRVRSFEDLSNAILGLQYSIALSALMHVIITSLITGLRPNFFDVCKPKVEDRIGFETITLDRTACTGDRRMVDYAFSSFPSGHATASFAGFIFLYLYLNAKFKVWSNYRPSCWKLVATYAPVLAAIVIAGLCTVDHSHHWYDVLAGAILGTVMAFSAYRMVYASVWDFRLNHIPLARHVQFKYGLQSGSKTNDNFHDAMWTREAGWGSSISGPWSGAPFDCAEPWLNSREGGQIDSPSEKSRRQTPAEKAEQMA